MSVLLAQVTNLTPEQWNTVGKAIHDLLLLGLQLLLETYTKVYSIFFF